MGTPKIKWNEGSSYHITVRGNHRNDIFRDEEDFQVYLTMLEESFIYYSNLGYELICYCLMDNHVHLMVLTGKEPLTRLMRRINSMYTKYFNKKYNYIGHLFQAKYHAEIIFDDKQFLEATRYVHLNPVKANMVEKPAEYEWSSYSMLIGEREEKLIKSELIHKYFKYEDRFGLYKEFVEAKLNKGKEEDSQKDIEEVI